MCWVSVRKANYTKHFLLTNRLFVYFSPFPCPSDMLWQITTKWPPSPMSDWHLHVQSDKRFKSAGQNFSPVNAYKVSHFSPSAHSNSCTQWRWTPSNLKADTPPWTFRFHYPPSDWIFIFFIFFILQPQSHLEGRGSCIIHKHKAIGRGLI